jgi:hypothetical protein
MDRRLWLLLTCCGMSVLAGCAQGQYALPRDIDSTDAMSALLIEQVPPGTSAISAQQIMERNQFTCELQRNKAFRGSDFTREGFDFLLCKRTDKAASHQVRCWQIALVLDGDVVSDAYVDISYTGR